MLLLPLRRVSTACSIVVWGQSDPSLLLPSQLFPARRENQRDGVNDRKCDGDEEYRARFRLGRPECYVYPHGSDAPHDVFPDHDHGEADEVHEEEDAEPGPLVVCVLVRLARFPGVPKFDAKTGVSCQILGRSKISGRTHKSEYGNMTCKGRTRKNLRGACMNATSSGRFFISGRW